jgi:hypothetical protein
MQVTDLEMRLVVKFLEFLYLIRQGGESNPESVADSILSFKSLWVAVFPPGDNFSYSFPNFDSVDAWPQLLKFFGPSFLYSGELWESHFKSLRNLKHGNGKNTERDMLVKHAKLKVLEWNELGMTTTQHQGKTDFDLIGQATKPLNTTQFILLSHFITKKYGAGRYNMSGEILWADKIWLAGHILKPGQAVTIKGLTKLVYGEFVGCFEQKVNSETCKWIEIEMYNDSRLQADLHLTLLREPKQTMLFPMGTGITVERCHIVGDSLNERCVNHWVKF